MEDITNNSFRELCSNHSADLTFTEMARVSALVKQNKSTMEKIKILNNVPTQIQLIPQKELELKTFLEKFVAPKNFSGFNINIGCPSSQLINLGLGCSMIKRSTKVSKFVEIVKEANFPCSIKMRLGLNRFEKQKKVYLNLINNVDADFFIVHARHGAESYDSKADYSVYDECVATEKTIIANGDVDSKEKVEKLKSIGVKGVMIGRAVVKNPAIFERLKGMKETSLDKLKKEYLDLSEKYHEQEKYKKNFFEIIDK